MNNLTKIKIYNSLILILLILITYSCRKEADDIKIKKNNLSGYVQKGPFINGTLVQMYELNSALNQTGKVFSTQIINNNGSFEINDIALSSQFVEFSASGYYFNEITGEISPSELSFYALSDITDLSSVNVNILTHLEKARVEYLVSNGSSFNQAKDTAQKEILSMFGFQLNEMDNSELLDIAVNTEENAILLAISLILQGNRSVGDLTELLANVTTDIKLDGKLNDTAKISKLRSSTILLDLPKIRSNLIKRYEDLGITATIPSFENYINNFLSYTGRKPSTTTQAATTITTTEATLNGTVNANDLNTTVTFEYGTTTDYGNSATAAQSPVSGHNNIDVNATITGLNPGTIYHYRVKSVNSLGTTIGNDVSFTTLGQVPTATTQAVTTITTTEATLNGTVNANDLNTTITFEYGTTTDYGNSATATQSPVTGHDITAVSTTITDLSPGTTYHYRVKSINSLGTTTGNDLSFTTLGQIPMATTQAATNISAIGATLNSTVNANDLSTTVTFEYGTTTDYGSTVTPIQSQVTGHTNTAISAVITELNPSTTYHFRVISVNSLGTTAGNDMTFSTLGKIPTGLTSSATNITPFGATLNGEANANDLSTIITFEYGTNDSYGNSIIALQSPLTGNMDASVNAQVEGLNPNTLYHFRIKAVNLLGVVYGIDFTFNTLSQIPIAISQPATDITTIGATFNGTVNANDLSTTVTFEYGTTESYGMIITAAQSPVTSRENTSVNVSISGLNPGTLYHFRIKSFNSSGTTYGKDMAFITPLPPVVDIEGNIYNTVGIGTQIWMASNLRTTKYNNGDPIPNVSSSSNWSVLSTGAYCDYNNDITNSNIYGKLYNHYVTTDSRGICPLNWHVSSQGEWFTLLTFLGGADVAGKAIKEAGTDHWATTNSVTNNSSGFTALPGGKKNTDGTFEGLKTLASFWSIDGEHLYEFIDTSDGAVGVDLKPQRIGASVRCVKDN